LAYGPRLDADRASALGATATALDALLTRSDAVFVCCPLTVETRGLLGETSIGLMGPRSVLVDVSRGGVVDASAVAAALSAGRLGAAAFDVFTPEPPPLESPILGAPRTLLAPHSVGYTTPMLDQLMADACDSVLAVLREEAP
jgi:D-3-phosphoglycerate dehydrogenase